jgi:hypothetical protein
VSGYSDRLRWAEDIYDIAGINLMAYDLGWVETNRETYIYVSPFYHARDVDTPLLIVGGEGLTPMRPFADEAARYFKPVRYEAYPYVGGAESRRQWMPRVLAFFDRHLRADLEIRPPPQLGPSPDSLGRCRSLQLCVPRGRLGTHSGSFHCRGDEVVESAEFLAPSMVPIDPDCIYVTVGEHEVSGATKATYRRGSGGIPLS